jgi:hypothetical protein
VLAAAQLRSSSQQTSAKPLGTNAVVDQHSRVKTIKAKAHSITSPNIVHLAAHVTTERRSTQALVVLIQSRQELPGFGTIQIETWRVFLISDVPPAHRAFPNKEI